MALRPVHRLDEPARLSLSIVASPQCRLRFARQDHCSSTTSFGQLPDAPITMGHELRFR
jgi:hypothetical protein